MFNGETGGSLKELSVPSFCFPSFNEIIMSEFDDHHLNPVDTLGFGERRENAATAAGGPTSGLLLGAFCFHNGTVPRLGPTVAREPTVRLSPRSRGAE